MAQQIVVNFLIHQRAMAYLTKSLPGFRTGLKKVTVKADAYYEYPDGSVQIEGPSVHSDLWNNLVPGDQLEQVDFNSRFRALKAFGGKSYCLWYTSDYEKKLGSKRFNVLPKEISDCSDEDCLDNLKITVEFKRKLSKKSLEQLADFLAWWLESVSVQGMFDEGSPASVSREIEIYSDRVARFTIDVHRSGQNTLNWLILSLLEFGYRVCLVNGVYFACEQCSDYPDKNFIELYAEVSLQNPRQVPIPRVGKSRATEKGNLSLPKMPYWQSHR